MFLLGPRKKLMFGAAMLLFWAYKLLADAFLGLGEGANVLWEA